ncbi:hypothetical protein D3C87_605980 [compost metagenome]
MMYRYSLHHVEHQHVCPFSEMEYSRFKFGETIYAEKFAEALCKGFLMEHKNLILEQEEIVLLPSPYHSIPTASNFLCFYFKRELNRFLFHHGRAACKESKIHRRQTYVEDYGNMDSEQRLKLISNDTYHLDRDFIAGKFCIFLDDIKITGSHEVTVERILKDHDVQGTFFFVYYAELFNRSIHPNIENKYNYFDVKSPVDLIRIINSASFCFNTRLVKYLLLLDETDFTQIVNQIPVDKISELFDLAISNNYHTIAHYQQNIIKLKQYKSWQSIYKKGKGKTSMHPNLQSA